MLTKTSCSLAGLRRTAVRLVSSSTANKQKASAELDQPAEELGQPRPAAVQGGGARPQRN